MSIRSNDLLETIKSATVTETNSNRLAIVTNVTDNGVYLKFYGDEIASQKPYKRIETYSAMVGDTVIVANINGSYVIMGKVV